MDDETKSIIKIICTVGFVVIAFTGLGMHGCPQYNVWQQGLSGQAELARAEQNRQIKIQEAKAAEDSAKHLASAEIARAHGVAVVVYVPTEANPPILEATRLKP